MKKYLLVLFVLVSGFASSQVPQAFNYQAQVRDSEGTLITNRNVSFKFNIKQGGPTTFPVYIEEHLTSTDDLGQVDLAIGYGTPRLGLFSEIDWMLGDYYLDVELDIGNGFIPMGVTSFLSVPYALFSETSGDSQVPAIQDVLTVGNNADNQQIKGLAGPTEEKDAANKFYVDQQVLDATQNLAQVLQEDNSANDQQIKELQDPTEPQDAVTKSYVDGLSNNQGLMNFNDWNNYQVFNDNTTVQLTPNSFVFVNAKNTTLVFPSFPENCCFGDVIYVYVMDGGSSDPATFNLQANDFPVAIKGYYGRDLIWTDNGSFFGNFNSAGLKTIVNVGDFWMVADFTGALITNPTIDDDGDGFTENEGDCNDNDATIYPGAPEICDDGIDQDCNGSDLSCNDVDNDGDGFTEAQGDCNDNNATIYPGAEEICDDGIDQDCDGSDCTTPPPPPPGDECSGSEIQDNFESYTDGQPIYTIDEGGHWTDWGCGGGPGCALMASSAQARSGNLSGFIPGDGSTDAVLDLGNKIFGQWGLEFWMYIPAGKTAYYNLQGTVPIGSGEWIVGNIFFNQDGANPGGGSIDDSALGVVEFTYPEGQWFPVVMNFDISQGIAAATWQFNINGNDVLPAGTPFTSADGTTATSVGGIDFFSIDTNNELYIDDLCYGEGFIGPYNPEPDVDNDGDGFTEAQGDCNDNNATIYPGAEEICDDGIDQDCDGSDCTTPPPPPPGDECSGSEIQDNFESYTDGQPIYTIDEGGHWTDWGCGGGPGCALMASSAQARSGNLSGFIPSDGSTDAVLDLGNKIFGQWGLEFWMYIPAGKTAYYNLQGTVPIGSGEWIVGNIFFNQDGANPGGGSIDDSALGVVEFTYPEGQWFPVVMNFDLSLGIGLATWQFNINGNDVLPAGTPFTSADGTTATSVGGIDFFSIDTNNELYIDDLCYGEGFIGPYDPEPDVDNDGDGFTEAQGDCNDNDATIYPGAEEICDDGIDQDCDGSDCTTPPPPPPGGSTGTSFEEPGVFNIQYIDTGDATSAHDLASNADEPFVNYTSTGGEMGFNARYEPYDEPSDGLTDGDFVGVTAFAGDVGEYTDGVQGYTVGDPDGNFILEFDVVEISNSPDALLTMDYYVNETGYEGDGTENSSGSDRMRIYVKDLTNNTEIDILNTEGSDINDLGIEGSWISASVDLPNNASVQLVAEVRSNSATETLYLDNISFYVGDPEPDVDNDGDGFTEAQGDCNDNDATIYPGAEEICDDGIDQDCNGVDLLAPTVDAGPTIDVCEGPFQITGASASNFEQLQWTTGSSGSFDNPNILAPIYTPSAEDILNGGGMLILTVENDCGVSSDEFIYTISPSGSLTLQGNDAQILCNGDQLETITYFPSNGGDVSLETLVTGLPSGIEFINNGGGGIDIFGTPTVDINVTTSYTYTISNYTWEGECTGDDVTGTITIQPCDDIDNDGDGFTENQGDCNDNDTTIYPGAEEICDDGIDQDCDGSDCESEPCDINNPSNNFETGIINSGNFIAANDLIITNNFTLTQINLNLFHEPSATISTLAITYYDDAGGVPGALIGAETLVPASQAVVGSNFGYNVSEVILDISPVNFTEGTYWIGITAVSSTGGLTAWETTSASSIGAGSAISEDGGNSWGSGRDDGVFTLIGTCND